MKLLHQNIIWGVILALFIIVIMAIYYRELFLQQATISESLINVKMMDEANQGNIIYIDPVKFTPNLKHFMRSF